MSQTLQKTTFQRIEEQIFYKIIQRTNVYFNILSDTSTIRSYPHCFVLQQSDRENETLPFTGNAVCYTMNSCTSQSQPKFSNPFSIMPCAISQDATQLVLLSGLGSLGRLVNDANVAKSPSSANSSARGDFESELPRLSSRRRNFRRRGLFRDNQCYRMLIRTSEQDIALYHLLI